MATLLHDDIIDRSPLRRHKESPYSKFGLDSSLLSGDFLLTRAFGLCATLDKPIIEATEKACIELTEGEILETPIYKDKHTVDTVITVGRKKTAALFVLAAFSAGYTHKLSPQQIVMLQEFGEGVGIAFQLLDDILDVTSTAEVLGKPPGTDIRERKPSIVNVLWLAGDPEGRKLLAAPPLSDPIEEERYVESTLGAIKEEHQQLAEESVLGSAKKLARETANSALTSLAEAVKELEPGEEAERAVELLKGFVHFTLERVA